MSRSSKPKPFCEEACAWLVARNGRGCLGALTGGSSRAFDAYLHLVDCWVASRSPDVVRALREVLTLLPSSVWMLAAEVIAAAGDWCHVTELWPQIRPAGAPLYRADGAGCYLVMPGAEART